MDKERLDSLYDMVKDIQKRVKKMERRERWRSIGSAIKWIVYVAIAVGTYYYIQPYIEQLQQMYTQIQETTSGINDLKNGASENISGLLDKFNLGGGSE